jgi:hypothetical protein
MYHLDEREPVFGAFFLAQCFKFFQLCSNANESIDIFMDPSPNVKMLGSGGVGGGVPLFLSGGAKRDHQFVKIQLLSSKIRNL